MLCYVWASSLLTVSAAFAFQRSSHTHTFSFPTHLLLPSLFAILPFVLILLPIKTCQSFLLLSRSFFFILFSFHICYQAHHASSASRTSTLSSFALTLSSLACIPPPFSVQQFSPGLPLPLSSFSLLLSITPTPLYSFLFSLFAFSELVTSIPAPSASRIPKKPTRNNANQTKSGKSPSPQKEGRSGIRAPKTRKEVE